MNQIAMACLLVGVFAVGCGAKGSDGGKSGSAAASGAAKGPAGSKACEDYFAKLKTCNEAQLKAAPDGELRANMKKTQEESEKVSRDSFKAMEGKTLDEACTNATKSLEAIPACK